MDHQCVRRLAASQRRSPYMRPPHPPPTPATIPTQVDPGCLSTEVPAPLNWGPLWCGGPGKEAKVMQWTDEVGSVHRTVDIPVQRNVTANMVLWMFTPAFPQ